MDIVPTIILMTYWDEVECMDPKGTLVRTSVDGCTPRIIECLLASTEPISTQLNVLTGAHRLLDVGGTKGGIYKKHDCRLRFETSLIRCRLCGWHEYRFGRAMWQGASSLCRPGSVPSGSAPPLAGSRPSIPSSW